MPNRTNTNDAVVLYYSNTGNNRFLARKIAQSLECELIPIIPKSNSIPVLIFQSWLRIGGIHQVKENLSSYEKVILCGPIWTGLLISPLRKFLKKYSDEINQLIFATFCGSRDEEKNDRFGYSNIFRKVKELMGEKCVLCEAFPIVLIVPEDKLDDDDYIMKARLTEQSFTGNIRERFNGFIQKVKSL